MKKKKISRTSKNVLYALLSSSLFCYMPLTAHAAEEVGITTEQSAQKESQIMAEAITMQQTFTLEGVEVTGDREKENTLPAAYSGSGGEIARGAQLGILGNSDIMDTPFNITSYTAKSIEDSQAHTITEVLEKDPSVRFTTSSGHMNENYTIRGFAVNASDLGLNGMYGMAPYGHVPTEFIERVEVLKGPSAMLSGMSPSGAIGGSINLITKRATDEPITRLTTDYTSSFNLGGHLDVGRRFGENKEWGVRFNGVYRDGKTGVDDESKTRELAAIGIDYRGKRLRTSVDAYYDKEKTDNGSSLMVNFASSVTSLPKAPDADTNAFSGTYGNIENKGAILHSEYDISPDLTAYAGVGTLQYTYDGYINSTHARNVNALGNYTAYTTRIRGYVDALSSEAGLRYTLTTGAVEHKIVLGVTETETESGNVSKVSSNYASNIYNPVTARLALDPGTPPKTKLSTLSSVGIADTLSFEEDKYLLTLGLRNQNIDSKGYSATTGLETSVYNESAVTPLIGLVAKPWKDVPVSLYANYIEGLSQGSTVTDTAASNYGYNFAPFKSKQIEAGVKWDAGKIANTLGVFQITKPSIILNTSTNNYEEDGEQRNRGVEWNVFGTMAQNLRILGGVAYTKAIQTHTTNGTNDGKLAYGTPEWQSNLGFEWDTPWKEGLTLTADAIYTGSQYANSANTLELPSWIRYDIGARYKTHMNGQPVVFNASVENLLDKNYWAGCYSDGYLTLASGRTIKMSVTFDIQ